MARNGNSAIEIIPLHDALGAEVRGVDLGEFDEAAIDAVTEAWHGHLVLLFRDQTAGDAAFLEFSRRFGELDRAPITVTGKPHRPDLPELAVISNVVENGRAIGSLGNFEAVWHTDMSYNKDPPRASLLYAKEIPPSGGDTSFCNMYAAYDRLSDELKRKIATLSCKHDSSHNSTGQARSGFDDSFARREDIPGAVHPLVCVHPETGRKVLYLGRRGNAYIVELAEAESEALLDELWRTTTRPELVLCHRWRVGDVVMWDNRCTMHRRDEFAAHSRRIMHRSQIKGAPMAAA
jgi:taurine dioxygenase